MSDPYLPHPAKILDFIRESPTVFTLRLQFVEEPLRRSYRFLPGQFNMVYLFGAGEVAISIVSDADDPHTFQHTIRAVGRVTQAMSLLRPGQYVGIRGPFGRGWPIDIAQNHDVVILTGGLGCAPVVAAINYILAHRNQYGALKILQGVKHSDDFIFHQRYQEWITQPKTEVFVAADHADKTWPWRTGRIIESIQGLELSVERTIVMMCGPEIMMHSGTLAFLQKQLPEENIYWSMERNMECGLGHCGHCQYGGLFICKDGPVFNYSQIKNLISIPGY